jgi:amino acid transporter
VTQTPTQPAETGREPGLRRGLSTWQVVALSIGTMAPSMAINVNPQAAAGIAGRAVPLTLLLATIAVLLVSYGFARLSQHFNHAGSVFGLVGATLGARPGAVAGWLMVGAYLLFGVSAAVTGGILINDLLVGLGALTEPSNVVAYMVAAVMIVIGVGLAIVPAKKATDLILIFEAVTVAIIMVIAVVVIGKLVSGHAPQGQRVDLSVFTPASGVPFSAITLAAVFGFLSFAGFESSAALGEEAREPKSAIPKALVGTAIGGGIFYVVVSAIAMMGFGVSDDQVQAFASSGSILGDLGASYMAPWVGDAVTIGSTISAVGGAVACVLASSRILYAIARDAAARRTALGSVSTTRGTPVVAAVVAGAAMIVSEIIAGSVAETPLQAYAFVGTVGVLLILVGYLLVTVGAIKLLFVDRTAVPSVPVWQVVVPVLAFVALGYVLFRNVWPYPEGVLAWLPAIAIGWLLVAVVAMLVAPDMARRIGARLTAEEQLQAKEA